MALIYKATCKTTGKSYIGYTTMTLKERFKTCGTRAHLTRAFELNCKSKFYNALRKYGWSDFTVSILEKMTLEQAKIKEDNGKTHISNREIYWIKKFDSYYNGYNMTLGGDGIFGLKLSEETKKKISIANKTMDKSYMKKDSVRQACSAGRKGKILVHKGSHAKYIHREQLLEYLELGYTRGQKDDYKRRPVEYSKEAKEHIAFCTVGSKFLYKDGQRKKFVKTQLDSAYAEGWKTLKDYRKDGFDMPDDTLKMYQNTWLCHTLKAKGH